MQKLNGSVHKTFDLLDRFTIQKPEWGVTELAKEIGANKSTVYRFLADMNNLGILQKHPATDKYSLGLKLFELGGRVNIKAAFVDKTHPVLMEVSKMITETVHIAVLKNNKVFYVDKVESPQGLKLSSQIGSHNPAHATALGKVLLAFLPEEKLETTLLSILDPELPLSYTTHTITEKERLLRSLKRIKLQAFAIDREELELGLICVAVPVFNKNGEVVASLSASGPANRFEDKHLQKYVSILTKGANDIQQRIGYFKP